MSALLNQVYFRLLCFVITKLSHFKVKYLLKLRFRIIRDKMCYSYSTRCYFSKWCFRDIAAGVEGASWFCRFLIMLILNLTSVQATNARYGLVWQEFILHFTGCKRYNAIFFSHVRTLSSVLNCF